MLSDGSYFDNWGNHYEGNERYHAPPLVDIMRKASGLDCPGSQTAPRGEPKDGTPVPNRCSAAVRLDASGDQAKDWTVCPLAARREMRERSK